MQRDRYLTVGIVIRPRASDIRNDSSWPVLPLKKKKKRKKSFSLSLTHHLRNQPDKVFDSNDLNLSIYPSSFSLSFLPSFLSCRETKDGKIARRENKWQRENGFEKWKMRWQRFFFFARGRGINARCATSLSILFLPLKTAKHRHRSTPSFLPF